LDVGGHVNALWLDSWGCNCVWGCHTCFGIAAWSIHFGGRPAWTPKVDYRIKKDVF